MEVLIFGAELHSQFNLSLDPYSFSIFYIVISRCSKLYKYIWNVIGIYQSKLLGPTWIFTFEWKHHSLREILEHF